MGKVHPELQGHGFYLYPEMERSRRKERRKMRFVNVGLAAAVALAFVGLLLVFA